MPGSLLFTTLLLVRETTKKKTFVQSLARWHCLAIGVWHRLSGFSSIGTRLSTQQGLANKIDRIKNARTRIVGIRVCAHAVVNLQGLASKVNRVKNARTGIVQGSWDEGLRTRRTLNCRN